MKLLRSIRVLVVLGALVALAVFVVLPAFASNPGDWVSPASTLHNATPKDVGIGGNGVCGSIFGAGLPTGYREYDNPNPKSGTYPSGNNDGVTFSLKLGGSNNLQTLDVDSGGKATIYGIGIKGGNDTTAYDYAGLFTGSPTTLQSPPYTGDTGLHAPAAKFTVTNGVETTTQYYNVSELNVCYTRAMTTISGQVTQNKNGVVTGIDGVTVTATDLTMASGTASGTTASGGYYSISVPTGDSFTVCSAYPSGGSFGETGPASGPACSSPSAPVGYSLSNVFTAASGNDFTFAPYGSLSGTVYDDGNQNGSYDGSPSDTGLGNWTVTLYSGITAANPGGTLAATTTSAADGSYGFSLLFAAGTTYRVCEAAPSGTWAQSEPLPSAADNCPGSTAKGFEFAPQGASDAVTRNFGNVPSTTCPPATMSSGAYTVELPGCKTGVSYAFGSGTIGADGTAYVSIWASDTTQPNVPMVEKMTFADPIQSGQPKYTKILYTDTFPFLASDLKEMPYCLRDPRDPSATDDLALPAGFTDTSPSSVVPSGATSCVLSIKTYVDANGDGKMLAYVYSAIDGLRTTG